MDIDVRFGITPERRIPPGVIYAQLEMSFHLLTELSGLTKNKDPYF